MTKRDEKILDISAQFLSSMTTHAIHFGGYDLFSNSYMDQQIAARALDLAEALVQQFEARHEDIE